MKKKRPDSQNRKTSQQTRKSAGWLFVWPGWPGSRSEKGSPGSSVSVKSSVLETKDYLRMPPYLCFGSCSFQDYSFTGCNILDLPRSIFVQGVCIRSKRTKNRLPAESRFCRQPVSSFMEMDASFEHAKNLPQFLDFHLGLSESLDCRLSGCGFWSGHSCSRPSVCLSPGRLFGH